MIKIRVINGPNLNMLGIREPAVYGKQTYKDLLRFIKKYVKSKKIMVTFYQSNCEGDIVSEIQKTLGQYDGIVLNAGAYTHYSYAILDALKAACVPTVEVHISDVDNREDFRKISVIRPACFKTISGMGFEGYTLAIDEIIALCEANK